MKIDKKINEEDAFSYDKLIGLGTDGANVMLGQRNSLMSQLRVKQPHLVALHCNCYIAALIANYSARFCQMNWKSLQQMCGITFRKVPSGFANLSNSKLLLILNRTSF